MADWTRSTNGDGEPVYYSAFGDYRIEKRGPRYRLLSDYSAISSHTTLKAAKQAAEDHREEALA